MWREGAFVLPKNKLVPACSQDFRFLVLGGVGVTLSATMQEKILATLESLVCIGAPTFQEKRRADYVYEWLQREAPGAEIGRDEDGNVWADLSDGVEKVHLFDAHTDTVFPLRNGGDPQGRGPLVCARYF